MNARILIVEDEEPLTMLLRYNLEAEGYEVETAARGDEADTRLKESSPDLIVLDDQNARAHRFAYLVSPTRKAAMVVVSPFGRWSAIGRPSMM